MRRYRSVGLISGTSMDGIDIAYIETDAESSVSVGPFASDPYPDTLRSVLLKLPAEGVDIAAIERELTDLHIDRVREFCRGNGLDPQSLDCIGFHGQTILHEPQRGRTWQLGDGARMAAALGRTVVNRFRDNDMRHGGQGAPFVPAYHRAIVRTSGLSEPVAVLNIGGVSNVTLLAADELHACDCGPGNALLDDWVSARLGIPYDDGGRISAAGQVDRDELAKLMRHPYFATPGAKSLDRNAFSPEPVRHLSTEDGAATLAAFTVAAIASEAKRLPAEPREWIVVGGGRRNPTLVSMLREALGKPVRIAEDLGWNGDAIEAEAFAYLAVRSLQGLPLSYPGTTGVAHPVTGGDHWPPPA